MIEQIGDPVIRPITWPGIREWAWTCYQRGHIIDLTPPDRNGLVWVIIGRCIPVRLPWPKELDQVPD